MTALQTYRSGALAAASTTSPVEKREARLRDAQTWWTATGKTEFISAFEHETAVKLANANRSAGARIEQGFPKNINEYDGKLKWDNYYIANALMAIEQIDRILQAPPLKRQPWLLYYNLHSSVKELLHDTLTLIEHWATFRAQVPGITGTGKNSYEQTIALYHSAAQVIHGNLSPFSFLDKHSDTAINQIRMAIEMRFRRGFGILAKLDKAGSIVPLALSEIITAVKHYQSSIGFMVPLQHIERLYGWANIYMHAGLKQYAWSPMVALYYLKPFLLGGQYSRGSSLFAGISTSRGVVRQVQEKVEGGIDKTRFSLVKLDPGNCELILK